MQYLLLLYANEGGWEAQTRLIEKYLALRP